ncbi:SIS domain-containing protein [Pseudactinotalea sp. Z1739]|uniref:SIS domain-containing protein n=1 Tax=Pseudactinotalea sp. Z1739 TaxID=3413028 RepID=UPI003C7A4AF1
MVARSGARMRADMAGQPGWLRGLADRRVEVAEALPAQTLGPAGAGLWTLARGSSAHAASMVAPWLARATGAPVPALRVDAVLSVPATLPPPGSVVIAISQSGRTPDVVEAARRLRTAGCHVVALVNERGALASEASHVLELGIGAERAIPATKTVLAQVALLWLLGIEAASRPGDGDGVRRQVEVESLVDAVAEALADTEPVDRAVGRLVSAPPVAGTGRGVTSGLAAEWAHKVMETSGLPIFAASAAELAHGPVAIAAPGRSVVGFAVDAAARRTVGDVLGRAEARGAETLLVAPGGAIALPQDELSGLLAGMVRAQMLAERMAVALGCDPDVAFGLAKVTATQ